MREYCRVLIEITNHQQVSAFCDDDANEANVVHDVQAPHPHNMKCGGKSVWKVVSSHPDFVG